MVRGTLSDETVHLVLKAVQLMMLPPAGVRRLHFGASLPYRPGWAAPVLSIRPGIPCPGTQDKASQMWESNPSVQV